MESLGHDRQRECRFISKRIFAEKTDILKEIGFGDETLAKEEVIRDNARAPIKRTVDTVLAKTEFEKPLHHKLYYLRQVTPTI
jgi:hypothetical protein